MLLIDLKLSVLLPPTLSWVLVFGLVIAGSSFPVKKTEPLVFLTLRDCTHTFVSSFVSVAERILPVRTREGEGRK